MEFKIGAYTKQKFSVEILVKRIDSGTIIFDDSVNEDSELLEFVLKSKTIPNIVTVSENSTVMKLMTKDKDVIIKTIYNAIKKAESEKNWYIVNNLMKIEFFCLFFRKESDYNDYVNVLKKYF